jgi:hypothetical protein
MSSSPSDCRRAATAGSIAAYEEGRTTGSIASFTGKALEPIDLCRLYGTIAHTTSP